MSNGKRLSKSILLQKIDITKNSLSSIENFVKRISSQKRLEDGP